MDGHGGAEGSNTHENEYTCFLKHSWCWPLDKKENAVLWEGAEGGDLPSVLELAGWMARDDGWLPKAEEAGTSLKKGPCAAELVEQVWALLPVGLLRLT